jgi:hypothetical protein
MELSRKWISGLIVGSVFALLASAAIAQNRVSIYTPTEKGTIEFNSRIGVWEYRDWPQEIAFTVDYTNGRLLYVKPDTGLFIGQLKNEWRAMRLTSPCRFHGSMINIQEHYRNLVGELPIKLIESKEEYLFWLSFQVGANGLAHSPEVINDPGFGTEDILLEGFRNAPNFWLVGIGENDQPVTCKFAIEFHVCPGKCTQGSGLDPKIGRVIVRERLFSKQPESEVQGRKTPSFLFTNESKGIQFSPDDQFVMLESIFLRPGTSVGRTHIFPVNGGESSFIPFELTSAPTWIDNNRILFKFNWSNVRSACVGVFNRATGEIEKISDSLTYFHNVCFNAGKIAFLTPTKNGVRIWEARTDLTDLKTFTTKTFQSIIPESWTPSGRRLVLLERENELISHVVVDSHTKRQRTVPLYNSVLAGWSTDETRLFLYKPVEGDYDRHGEIYVYNLQTDELTRVMEKTKRLWAARYSGKKDLIALNIGGDLFLERLGDKDSRKRIAKDDVFLFAWSNDGSKLAYLNNKDKRIYLYSVVDGHLTVLARP